MQYMIYPAILFSLLLIYRGIKAWFLDRKSDQQTEQLTKDKKDEAKKTADADAAYNEFMRKLHDYKADGDS